MSSRIKLRFVSLMVVLAAVAAPSAQPTVRPYHAGKPPPRPAVGQTATGSGPQRYLVVLKPTVADPGAVAAAQANAYGAQVTHVYNSALKGYSATIPSDRVALLRANAQVRFLSPDRQMSASDQTVGTGVARVKAVSKPDKGAGVNVAVIDTGIDTSHPDLAANIAGGYNCSTGGKQSYTDGNGHGTHVAGIIAAL